ncbi:unnamed protein product [Sphagnum compactum]
MFGIVHAGDADDDGDEFETFEQWRIERVEFVLYVKDQGSFPKLCYKRLDAPAQKEVMSQFAQYAMFIVTGLGNIRAERDENNEPFEQDALPVMPNQIVKLRHGDFIEQVERLRAFLDGLATAFANTIAVESDFSILKWEMDEFRTCLMHLSLEGIFQTKQHPILQSLEY